MTDLFQDKAADWDARPIPAQISEGVGQALRARLNLRDDMTVMDFGAGTGLVCGQLAPLVGKIYAVDISEAMLAQLAQKPELAGKVEIRCQDLLEQPLDEHVELVVSAMALHHVQDTPRLLKCFHSHLTADGRVALADLDAEDGSFHPADAEGVFHHGFDRDALRGLLEQTDFVDVELSTATTVTKEGRPYSVFLATARKP